MWLLGCRPGGNAKTHDDAAAEPIAAVARAPSSDAAPSASARVEAGPRFHLVARDEDPNDRLHLVAGPSGRVTVVVDHLWEHTGKIAFADLRDDGSVVVQSEQYKNWEPYLFVDAISYGPGPVDFADHGSLQTIAVTSVSRGGAWGELFVHEASGWKKAKADFPIAGIAPWGVAGLLVVSTNLDVEGARMHARAGLAVVGKGPRPPHLPPDTAVDVVASAPTGEIFLLAGGRLLTFRPGGDGIKETALVAPDPSLVMHGQSLVVAAADRAYATLSYEKVDDREKVLGTRAVVVDAAGVHPLAETAAGPVARIWATAGSLVANAAGTARLFRGEPRGADVAWEAMGEVPETVVDVAAHDSFLFVSAGSAVYRFGAPPPAVKRIPNSAEMLSIVDVDVERPFRKNCALPFIALGAPPPGEIDEARDGLVTALRPIANALFKADLRDDEALRVELVEFGSAGSRAQATFGLRATARSSLDRQVRHLELRPAALEPLRAGRPWLLPAYQCRFPLADRATALVVREP
jgi:hypothetical protein